MVFLTTFLPLRTLGSSVVRPVFRHDRSFIMIFISWDEKTIFLIISDSFQVLNLSFWGPQSFDGTFGHWDLPDHPHFTSGIGLDVARPRPFGGIFKHDDLLDHLLLHFRFYSRSECYWSIMTGISSLWEKAFWQLVGYDVCLIAYLDSMRSIKVPLRTRSLEVRTQSSTSSLR